MTISGRRLILFTGGFSPIFYNSYLSKEVHKVLKLTKMLRRKNKVGKTYRKRWGGVKSLDRVLRKDLTEKMTCEQKREEGERER